METLVPLLILVPSVGTLINFFWGAKMGERAAGYLATGASFLTFIFSLLIFNAVNASHAPGAVVEPFFLDGWIRIGSDLAVDIPWEFRVDSLTVTMLLVITGVGSLIHLYSIGYIHGDEKAPRFFAFLNMFLAFMLLLVTGNNLLMMFVGWEGVGVCSFLLIGYWWDKKGDIGWQNSNAARKAMILNRIGDFGILMAVFLTFWTFGTLDYYKPGESSNVCYALESNGYTAEAEEHCGHHGEEGEQVEADADHAETDEEHSEDAEQSEGDEDHAETDDHSEGDDEHGTAVADDHSESDESHGDEGGHGEVHLTVEQLDNSLFNPNQLGIFNQAQHLMALNEGEVIEHWSYNALSDEWTPRGRDIELGPFTLDIRDMLVLIVLFLLLGAAGKSAQIPLFVWLPDAMAGPTPVSALMHAATMVTAGIYLLVRSNVFLDLVPEARFVVAIIGATTAFAAGLAAVGQWDIKRVLAYSTISQLGFMIAAVGIGAYVAAMFHLVTHAVFKALLFLGSGSIIHGVEHGEHHVHEHHGHDEHHDEHHDDHAFDAQDMRNMGGLAGRMPVTFLTYLIGTFGLMGLPFFAGFWSKDEILLEAFLKSFTEPELPTLQITGALLVFTLLTVAAFFTTFYMWRQIQMVFYGEPRSEAAEHAPESTPWMTIPLFILALGVFWIGFINLPHGTWIFEWVGNWGWNGGFHGFGHFLEKTIPSISQHEAPNFSWWMAIATSVILPAFAILLAHFYYAGEKAVRDRNEEEHELGVDPLYKNPATRPLWVAANRRLYSDDLYHAIFLYPYERIGKFLAETLDWNFWHDYLHNNIIKAGFDAFGEILSKPIDIGIIDAIVNGVGKVVSFFSGRSRGIQTGYVRTYAVAVFVGVVVVIVLMLLPLWLNGS